VGLTSYSEHFSELVDTMFPPTELRDTLGEVVSNAGLRQLRIAETEKYAHVTFFLNGGREMLYPGEERILVSSPQVATYDLQPEMSAPEVTEKLIDAIKSDRFELIVVNFANSDMVGHTGNIAAAVKAVETVDQCLGSIAKVIEAENGAMLITSDHGNVEQMLDLHAGQPHTAHTLNPVPLVAIGIGQKKLVGGRLSDVAPTVLALMGLSIPSTMTGNVLFSKNASTVEDHLVTKTSA
jgi:2,3-bisphosphoglycerate-independent phosphoglycerate mutase